jgi:hypothetical protein
MIKNFFLDTSGVGYGTAGEKENEKCRCLYIYIDQMEFRLLVVIIITTFDTQPHLASHSPCVNVITCTEYRLTKLGSLDDSG